MMVERTLRSVPAPLLAILAIVLIQVGAAVAKGLFADLGAAGVVLLRAGFSALVLAAVHRPHIGGRQARLLVAGGLGAALGGMNLAFYAALERIPLGVAVTLEFTGPLGVAIAGSRRRLDLLWALMAAAGILLLTRGPDSPLDPLGVAYGLAAGVLWAAYILLTARTGRLFKGGEGLAIALVVAAVLVAPVGVLSAGSRLLEPRLLALGLLVALLSSAIPYSLEMESLRRLPARTFGVLMSLEPAFGAVVGALALGEALGWRATLAVGLVVAASLGATLRRPDR